MSSGRNASIRAWDGGWTPTSPPATTPGWWRFPRRTRSARSISGRASRASRRWSPGPFRGSTWRSRTSTPPGKISSAAAWTSARWRSSRSPPGSPTCLGARTSRTRRSATRTATAGCSRRSRPGCPGGNGRTDMEVAPLADLLHETAEHHGSYEAIAPPHDWWDWYAAYMDARQGGSGPDEADAVADRYMAEVKHVAVSRG